jgi:nitroreductase
MTPRKALILIIGLAVGIFAIAGVSGLYEKVNSGEIVVKQSVLGGDLILWTDSGPHWQGWGDCTHYPRSQQLWFSSDKKQGNEEDESISTRFNDGGHGKISGSVRFTLPLDYDHMVAVHRQFKSMDAIEKELIRTLIQNAVYASGSLVSSTESYAEKRSELMEFIIDQATNGRLRYHSNCVKQPDPITKIEKTVCSTTIDKDDKAPGHLARLEESAIAKYGITLTNWSFNEIQYDDDVKGQIKAQQAAVAAVQTAIAQAKQAEQNAITVEQQGKAEAAKAKWLQEVEAAKAVTKAEQEKKEILLGEGEAKRRELVMKADNALDKRTERDIKIAQIWADAYAKQRPTPDIVFGSNASSGSDLGQMMMLAAAKQAGIVPPAK